MDAFQYIQITAAFSNAVLNAVLPGVWSFSSNLELDTLTSAKPAQVASLSISDVKGRVDGTLELGDGFQFSFCNGEVHAFSSPRNLFAARDWSSLDRHAGKARMSEREAVELARCSLRQLGYDPSKVLLTRPPDHIEHVAKLPNYSVKDFAFYSMTWKLVIASSHVVILSAVVDAHEKKLCGIYTGGRRPELPPLELPVEPPILATVPLPFAEPERYVFVTPAYSNAMLNVVLPAVSTFARQLDPDGSGAVLRTQLVKFDVHDRKGWDDGSLELTNGKRFRFSRGYVGSFESSRNIGSNRDWEHWELYAGKARMTRSEVLLFARQALARLGYDPVRLGLMRPPDLVQLTDKLSSHPKLEFAHYSLRWETRGDGSQDAVFALNVDAHERKVCYFSAFGRQFWRPPFKGDVEPPLRPPVTRPSPQKLIVVPNPPAVIAPAQPAKP